MTAQAAAPDEQAEVVAAAQGDHHALTALWNRHRRWVAAVLLAHKPSHAELDDLLQEVAMAVIRNIHTVRDAASIRPWLRTVAINAARLAARTANARPKLRLVGDEFESHAAEPAHDGRAVSEDAQLVMREVMALPETYREPLLLRAVHGMTYERMAETLGLSVEAVESRIVRARRMIRERAAQHDAAAEARSSS